AGARGGVILRFLFAIEYDSKRGGVTCRVFVLGSPVSSWRKPGPITPRRRLAKTRCPVLLPPLIDRFRGMGPGFCQDDVGETVCIIPSAATTHSELIRHTTAHQPRIDMRGARDRQAGDGRAVVRPQ